MTRLEPQPWMKRPQAVKLMNALGEAQFVGGAVRNALLGKPVTEVDIATPLLPENVKQRLVSAGIKAVPTGIEHGTITAVVDGTPYEVTTLRRDVETDGRRAVVAFTTDWAEDAQRRDFTMNALYASLEGEVLDTVGGVDDLNAGRVRFVGNAVTRIREDYLRILRLFRFHAWYGRGDIDAEALRAASQEKQGLTKLSGERIAKEMLRLLEAESPAPTLSLMAEASILAEVFHAEPNIARLESLTQIDAANFFPPDALLRLAALFPAKEPLKLAQTLVSRWRLSNARRERLCDLAGDEEKILPDFSARDVRKLLYQLGPQRFKDRLMLAWAEEPRCAVEWRALLAMIDNWQRPRFPLTGDDVMRAGVPKGPLVGQVLGEVESWWIDSDFPDDAFSLAERLKAVVQAVH